MNRFLKMLIMMLTCSVMYVDGGDGGGSDGGDNGEGGAGSEGGDGGGDVLLAGKYKDASALEAGYNELQTAFSGKDEAHTAEIAGFKTPEELTAGEDWGSDNAMDNRMMAVFQEVSKEHNMPQGMYEALVNGMVDMQTRVETDNIAEVKKSIANFDNRANAVLDTALTVLRPDQAKGLDALMTTKDSFEAIELLMARVRGGALPPNGGGNLEVNQDELRKQIRELNPSDTVTRAKLLKQLNDQGDGEGTLI